MAHQQAVTFYREADADPDALSGQTVAVVGYGNLGRSMALNLRDSGLAVTVGNADDAYRPTAVADRFEVAGIAEAVATADLVYVLIPDEVIPEVFAALIAPSLRPGTCVCFASGYVLAYGLVTPPPGVDVLVEQAFGAYLGVALQSAFQVGTEAGLPAEAMVVELYQSGEMARTLQAFADNGFFRSVTWHGLSAAFGGFLRTTEIDMQAMQDHFRKILEDIRSGGFARRFQQEQEGGYPTLAAIEAIT